VVHNEPITVRILSGKNGLPLANQHLILIGGYDRGDLHEQIYREDALTDSFGYALLSNQLANLPWLQVWVGKLPLCQSNPRKSSFSVELIRRDGLSAPNLCGPVSARKAPGLFTVFVWNRAKKLKPGASIDVDVPVNAAAPAVLAEASASTRLQTSSIAITAEKIVVPAASSVAPQRVDSVVGGVSAAPTAMQVAPSTMLAAAASKAALISSAATPAFAISAVRAAVIPGAKAAVRQSSHRIAARAAVHRARPLPVSCAVEQLPPPKDATTPVPRRKHRVLPEDRVPVHSAHRSKPLAGVRMAAKKPIHPTEPPSKD
jgi:hypothetical protein